MPKTVIGSLFFLAALALASPALAQGKFAQKLNGAWTSDLMTVRIDLDKGTYTGIALGEPFNSTVKLVEENPDYLVIEVTGKNGASKSTVQFQPGGGIIMTKEGTGFPVAFTPKED